jgi:hypothetical protein
MGIASRYPGDVGIEKDPAVVFHHGFEDCTTPADLERKWDVWYWDQYMSITEEAANVNGGRRALQITMPKQHHGYAVAMDRTLAEKRDTLFLRFYSKFDSGFGVRGTSMHNGGSMAASYHDEYGGATPGIPADGKNKFLVNFETEIGTPGGAPSPGALNVYIYHPEQRGDYGDHFYPTGTIVPGSSIPHSFGPHFVPRPDFVPELGRWYCFEYMTQANTPGKRDGRIACWVDGKLIADFPTMRLRDVETLKIDRFGIGLYIASNRLRENTKWYDDVVAATSYIGPRLPAKSR